MDILIVGATGLVGSHALSRALRDPRVHRVVAPTRRPLPAHPKLFNPVSDLLHLPDDPAWWKVDSVICALGTTLANAGSAEKFRAVDFQLVVDIAKRTHAHGTPHFIFVSSIGANPHSRNLYLRTKGEVEQALAHIGWASLTIVRPGLILDERKEVRRAERIAAVMLRILRPVLGKQWRGNRAEAIAATLMESAVTGASGHRMIDSGEINTNFC